MLCQLGIRKETLHVTYRHDELTRVAERGFRGGDARTRHPHGMGLGLAIVRDVAERHGMKMVFERPDEGGLLVRLTGERMR